MLREKNNIGVGEVVYGRPLRIALVSDPADLYRLCPSEMSR
jgi:hypothetical protein